MGVCGYCGSDLPPKRRKWCKESHRVQAFRERAHPAAVPVELPESPNRVSAEAMVGFLREMGRLEAVDVLLVTAVLELASAVDSDSRNAALWGQYRAAEASLRGVGQGDSDAGDAILAEFAV